MFRPDDFDHDLAAAICRYAGYATGRGWVHNTLGNIAVRAAHPHDREHGVLYTKHLGVSLEEMTAGNVVVTDIARGNLLFGCTPPSIGNQMNREVLRHRPDVLAVLHLHVNATIAWFSVAREPVFRFISIDAPLVLGSDVAVLEPEINVETDAAAVGGFIRSTNAFIMPNHGVTTVGRSLSEAYHRMTSLVAEMERVTQANLLAAALGRPVAYLPDDENEQIFSQADAIVRGVQDEPRMSGRVRAARAGR